MITIKAYFRLTRWERDIHVLEFLTKYVLTRVKIFFCLSGTFKVKKQELMQEGFDINRITDPMFFADSGKGTYVPITASLYQNILNGNVRLWA